MIFLTIASGALAVWCWIGARPQIPQATKQVVRVRSKAWIALVVIVITLILALSPRLGLWTIGIAVIAITTVMVSEHFRSVRMVARGRSDTVNACTAISFALQSGDIPATALRHAARDIEALAVVSATQEIGGDVGASLASLADRPGCDGFADLGRAWQLCEATGAPITPVTAALSNHMRKKAAVRRTVDAELASAKMSGLLFSFLPLLGVAMGYTVGSDSLAFLLGTTLGTICLVAAVCLACVGLVWTIKLSEGE